MLKHETILTKRRLVKNIFGDRSSLALRALLREPEKKWTLSELAKEGVSLGLASDVLSQAETLGYVERFAKGPESYTRLIRKEDLLADWTKAYSFEQNDHEYYLSPDKNFMKHCAKYFQDKKKRFALSGYSASRLISPYVKDDRHFIYMDVAPGEFRAFLGEMESQLNLYKLVHGGNVCFLRPFYRSSVFKDSRIVRGVPVVSNLQLYLDLMTFPPTGPEEAGHLVGDAKKKGKAFV